MLDLSKVVLKLKSSKIEELTRLKSKVNDEGNEHVEIDWEFRYKEEYNELLSIFTIKPKTPNGLITCVLAGMADGDNILLSGLSSQLSELSAEGDGSYTGWAYCNYTPVESVRIDGEIYGTVQLSNGRSSTFKFEKSITINV